MCVVMALITYKERLIILNAHVWIRIKYTLRDFCQGDTPIRATEYRTAAE